MESTGFPWRLKRYISSLLHSDFGVKFQNSGILFQDKCSILTNLLRSLRILLLFGAFFPTNSFFTRVILSLDFSRRRTQFVVNISLCPPELSASLQWIFFCDTPLPVHVSTSMYVRVLACVGALFEPFLPSFLSAVMLMMLSRVVNFIIINIWQGRRHIKTKLLICNKSWQVVKFTYGVPNHLPTDLRSVLLCGIIKQQRKRYRRHIEINMYLYAQ